MVVQELSALAGHVLFQFLREEACPACVKAAASKKEKSGGASCPV